MSDRDTIKAVLGRLTPLDDELDEAVKASLLQVTGNRTDIVGVAVLTDTDAGTLVPVAETATHLRHAVEEDPAGAVYHQWEPDDWELAPGTRERTPLDAIADRVRPLGEGVAEGRAWMVFTEIVYSWVVESLSRLVERGWFAERYPGAVVTLHVTDADTPAGNIIERVELLNPPDVAAPYVARLLADER